MATDPAERSFVTKHAAMNITRFKKKKDCYALLIAWTMILFLVWDP
jgi:hypothetical protein